MYANQSREPPQTMGDKACVSIQRLRAWSLQFEVADVNALCEVLSHFTEVKTYSKCDLI